MNETIQSILNRRCIRSYEERDVEEEKINAILECGKYAPSAMVSLDIEYLVDWLVDQTQA